MSNDDIFDWYWQPNDLLRQTLATATSSKDKDSDNGGNNSTGISAVATDPVVIVTQTVVDVVGIKAKDLGVCQQEEQQHQSNSQQMKTKLAQLKQ